MHGRISHDILEAAKRADDLWLPSLPKTYSTAVRAQRAMAALLGRQTDLDRK